MLHQDIPESSQKRLHDIVQKYDYARLTFINAGDLLMGVSFNDDMFATKHNLVTFTKETLYRCIPTLISEFDRFDRIVYSDVDIIVVDDISELFEIGLGDNYLAAPHTPQFLDHQIKHLDPKFMGHYFGGGLWVMNLKKMRENNLGDRIIKIIKDPPCRLLWNDQDVMNLACDFKSQNLSYRYVSIPTWMGKLQNLDFQDAYYPNDELKDAMYCPKIIHFAYKKPWIVPDISKAKLWFYWLDKTGFTADEFPMEWKLQNRPNLLERLLSSKLIGLAFLLMLSCIPLLGRLVKDKYRILGLINAKLGVG